MNQEEEYIGIAEFAERAGCSKQAVYQRLNKSLKKYVKVEKGKKCINIKALEDLYSKEVEQVFQGKSQDVEQGLNKEIQGMEQLVDVLKEQLKVKDKQIDELHNLLNQQQQLTAMNAKKVAELEDKLAKTLEPDAEPQDEPKEKKKWWMFWR